jgi:hypothetical protein
MVLMLTTVLTGATLGGAVAINAPALIATAVVVLVVLGLLNGLRALAHFARVLQL